MILAAIPLKRLEDAKGRLAPSLTPLRRKEFTLLLLERVVAAVLQAGTVDGLALVTLERAQARRVGALWLPDAGTLNGSITTAVRWAEGEGARALLVLPGDLPDIGPDDVRAMTVPGNGPRVVIAPSHDGGTNGLLLQPPSAIEPRFGPASAYRHLAEARRCGIETGVVQRPGLAWDVDTPADLARLLAAEGAQ